MKDLKNYIRTKTIITFDNKQDYERIIKMLINLDYAHNQFINYWRDTTQEDTIAIVLDDDNLYKCNLSWYKTTNPYKTFEFINAKEFLGNKELVDNNLIYY